MTTFLGHRSILSSGVLIVAMMLGSNASAADPVPQARRTDWTYTGIPGGIPNRTNICATFSPGATASAINSAISACSSGGGGVVKLNAGTYTISGISLNVSNVTLRGEGADKTILKGGNIVNLGSGFNSSLGVAITGGAAKDSRTFTVASASGLAVNRMIEIDRDNDPAIVVSTSGGVRHLRQVNLITAISGNTVTVKNPLFIDFTTGNPKIKFTFTHVSFSGIEDLKLDHSGFSSGTNLDWQYCYACWLKGVESYKPSGYHMVILGTLNLEIRDSYIHDAQSVGSNNAGIAVYGSALYGSNSTGKIENNVFDKLFPAIEMQNSSSGFYLGYNYGYGSMCCSTASVSWMFTDNHGPHDMMNLWEGNISELFGSDGYFGGSSHATVLRNYFTGYNPLLGGDADTPIRLNRLTYYYNLVGNVLGSLQSNPQKYLITGENCNGDCRGIYSLGYPNIGNYSLTEGAANPVPGGMTYPDAKVASTLLRWGNYNYFNDAAVWNASEIPSGVSVPADQVLPTSYYYTARPPFFPAGAAWPPIGPDVTGGTGDAVGRVHKIPAQLCWDSRQLLAGGSFSAAACYPAGGSSVPSAPTNLRIIGGA